MNVLRIAQGLAEIDHVHRGDLEVTGGVALLSGRVTGDVTVHGGRVVVSGIVEGNVDNLGGAVLISGTVLGSITGSPAYTNIEMATAETDDSFASWDPVAAANASPGNAAQSSKRSRRPDRSAKSNRTVQLSKPIAPPLRTRLWNSLTALAVAVATIGALAAVGDNAAIAETSVGGNDGAAIIQVVEKSTLGN